MYYVSSYENHIVGITNSLNGVEAFYKESEVFNLGFNIQGMYGDKIFVWDVHKFLMKYKLAGLLDDLDIELDSSNNVILNRYKGCNSVFDVPDCVNILGRLCLLGSNIKEINIPKSVHEFNPQCFQCSDIEVIDIPDTISFLPERCFMFCRCLRSIVIPKSVESIESACFSGCSMLKSIVIPDSVKYISTSCFFNCYNLKEVICEGDNAESVVRNSEILNIENIIIRKESA